MIKNCFRVFQTKLNQKANADTGESAKVEMSKTIEACFILHSILIDLRDVRNDCPDVCHIVPEPYTVIYSAKEEQSRKLKRDRIKYFLYFNCWSYRFTPKLCTNSRRILIVSSVWAAWSWSNVPIVSSLIPSWYFPPYAEEIICTMPSNLSLISLPMDASDSLVPCLGHWCVTIFFKHIAFTAVSAKSDDYTFSSVPESPT